MRLLFPALVLSALAGPAWGAGFSDRALSPGEILALLPGEDEWEGQEYVRDAPPEPEKKKDEKAPRGALALQIHGGGLLPFLAKEADYSAGGAFGVGGRLRAGSRFPNWIRISADLGFIAAEEDKWDGRSTLLLLNLDVGHNLLEAPPLRLSAFFALGAGLEFFSGTELGEEGWVDVSETGLNLLAGGGASGDLAISERFGFGLFVRLAFPLGSRNVQGLLMFGIQGAYAF